jgi:hypothetical protein
MGHDELGMTDAELRILLRAQRECGLPLPHDEASAWAMIRKFAVVGAFQCLERPPPKRGPKLGSKWSKPKEDTKQAKRKRDQRAKNQAPSRTLWELVWPLLSEDEREKVLKERDGINK